MPIIIFVIVVFVVLIKSCLNNAEEKIQDDLNSFLQKHIDYEDQQFVNSKNNQKVVEKGIPIPSYHPRDTGKYFLLEKKRNADGSIKTLYKRVDRNLTQFYVIEFYCSTGEYKEVAYGEETLRNVKDFGSGDWYKLDMVSRDTYVYKFVCTTPKKESVDKQQISAAKSSEMIEKGELIPRSVDGDRGQYYLLDKVKMDGGIIATLHKRIGTDGTAGYTRLEFDCSRYMVKEVGYGEGSVENIEVYQSDWIDLVDGSSKSDLFNYVCR